MSTIENTLKVAQKMAYNGINPIVNFIDKVYHKGIKVADKEFKELENFVKRNPDLPLWDVYISPHKIA